MKLGITTQTFLRCLNNGECTEADILRFSARSGFAWVELRDKGFHLQDGELARLRNLGDQLGLRLHYAWDCAEGLSPTQEMYAAVLARAAAFGAGTQVRVILPPVGIDLPGLIRRAGDLGIVLAFENAYESPDAFSAFLRANPTMAMTFDPSNFLCVPSEPKRVRLFFEDHRDRIPYIHIKCTQSGILVPDFIEGGDMDWETFPFDPQRWFCIELPAEQGLESTFARVLHAKDRIIACSGKQGPSAREKSAL
jgi:sugar phosphate isomerase/epimerase